MPSPKDFQEELNKLIREATKLGLPFVDITSGELHRKAGGYPAKSHRMPICCHVMRQYMNSNDSIVNEPPKGAGATLTIRYVLPR